MKFTDLVIAIPVFKDGKPTGNHMDYSSLGEKSEKEIVAELRAVFKDCGITHIKEQELIEFAKQWGVYRELKVNVFESNDKIKENVPFAEAIKTHRDAVYREGMKMAQDSGTPDVTGMIVPSERTQTINNLVQNSDSNVLYVGEARFD